MFVVVYLCRIVLCRQRPLWRADHAFKGAQRNLSRSKPRLRDASWLARAKFRGRASWRFVQVMESSRGWTLKRVATSIVLLAWNVCAHPRHLTLASQLASCKHGLKKPPVCETAKVLSVTVEPGRKEERKDCDTILQSITAVYAVYSSERTLFFRNLQASCLSAVSVLDKQPTEYCETSYEEISIMTERRGRVVNTPSSYSRGPGFRYRPGDRLSWLRFSSFFSVPEDKCWDSTLILGYERFFPTPFPIHHSLITPSFDAVSSTLQKKRR
jgi:hypothetical protein